MKLFKKLKYWYWRKFKDIPCPEETREAYLARINKNPKLKRIRSHEIARMYATGLDINTIANAFNVTRTRVRWCIYRVCRPYKGPEQ